MKKYENTDTFYERIHTLEITLQLGEYKGSFKQTIGGNCFGLTILHSFDPDCLGEDEVFLENNCNFKTDGRIFSCVLKNDDGEESNYEDDIDYLKDIIVKLEIVDCVVKKEGVECSTDYYL